MECLLDRVDEATVPYNLSGSREDTSLLIQILASLPLETSFLTVSYATSLFNWYDMAILQSGVRMISQAYCEKSVEADATTANHWFSRRKLLRQATEGTTCCSNTTSFAVSSEPVL